MSRITTVPALSLVLVGLACAPADQAPPPSEPEMTEAQAMEAFDALVEAWDVAQNAGDVDAIMALYGVDPAAMPPDMAEASGEGAVRELWGTLFGARQESDNVDNVLQGFRTSGDLAVIWGTYTITSGSEGEEVGGVVGKWMGILERQADGSWKSIRNIWNTDQAAGM